MKKVVMMLLGFVLGLTAHAQEEMKEAFVTEVDHSFNNTGYGEFHGYSYAASQKEVTVIDNATGKIRWNKKFSEISDELGKVDEMIPLWDADAIFLFDRKMGKDKMACVDAQTGKLLWITAKYQGVEEDNVVYIKEMDAFAVTTKQNLTMIKARTGEELWVTDKFKGIVGYYVYMTDGTMVMINMKSSLIGAMFAGFKNQLLKINTKNGEVIWDQDYRGMVEKKVITKERLVKINIEDNKVFLYLNGVQVYDLGTGKPLWSAAFDQTPDVVKKPAGATKFGAYGVVAEPVIVGENVYVLDMENKKNQFLKKYVLKTGKMIWRSAEIQNARAIPGIYVVGNRVVLQVGGQVELQHVVTKRDPNGTTTTYTIESENVKPMNIQCFDAITGEQIWESEKMKKGLTNLFTSGDNVIVCSGKALYSLDINTGKENYEKELKEDNIGFADLIVDFNDQVIIVGEKGVSSRSKTDGSLKASSKFKRSTPVSHDNRIVYGESTMALYTRSGDFAIYDLKTCKYKVLDARKGATAFLSDDGMSLFVFETGNMMRKSKISKLTAN